MCKRYQLENVSVEEQRETAPLLHQAEHPQEIPALPEAVRRGNGHHPGLPCTGRWEDQVWAQAHSRHGAPRGQPGQRQEQADEELLPCYRCQMLAPSFPYTRMRKLFLLFRA